MERWLVFYKHLAKVVINMQHLPFTATASFNRCSTKCLFCFVDTAQFQQCTSARIYSLDNLRCFGYALTLWSATVLTYENFMSLSCYTFTGLALISGQLG